MKRTDVAIIGGGFYGCCLALFMRGYFDEVLILEKETDLLLRASAINQARVHTGYHYPRSFLTAYRSFVNFPRFLLDFRKAIIGDFTKLYAVSRKGSKVNARRFHEMFRQMKARISVASPAMKRLFNQELVEEVFLVEEVAFDAAILRELIRSRLDSAGVKVQCGVEVDSVMEGLGGNVRVLAREEVLEAGSVFNCTYSRINTLLKNSGIPLLPLKHELTEMALVEVPEELHKTGITVMDGPFFSVMPYPSRALHSLSHVRYTPHHHWSDLDDYADPHRHLQQARIVSNYVHMIRDAQRFVPSLRAARHVDSLYEIKTVLLQNEIDDGRPILWRQDHGVRNFSTVMGGKIDNIYDVLEMIGEAKTSLGLNKDIWRYLFPRSSERVSLPGN